MERPEILHRELEGLRKDNCREQVDGVPDTTLRQKAVEHREQSHDHAARQSPFDPCFHWVDLDGDNCPIDPRRDRNPRYFRPLRDDACSFELYRHGLLTLIRQYLT